ncbi:hypothetical protein E4U19_005767, partial [Claviceps sp. Clav32 group G5]
MSDLFYTTTTITIPIPIPISVPIFTTILTLQHILILFQRLSMLQTEIVYCSQC